MEPIVARCPETGLEFEVGIETDRQSFATLPHLTLGARCPHCGQRHEWSTASARLREAGEARCLRRLNSRNFKANLGGRLPAAGRAEVEFRRYRETGPVLIGAFEKRVW